MSKQETRVTGNKQRKANKWKTEYEGLAEGAKKEGMGGKLRMICKVTIRRQRTR